MPKWVREYDDEVFDENTINDAVNEVIGPCELLDATREVIDDIRFTKFWEGLSAELQEEVLSRAYRNALADYFCEYDDDEWEEIQAELDELGEDE